MACFSAKNVVFVCAVHRMLLAMNGILDDLYRKAYSKMKWKESEIEKIARCKMTLLRLDEATHNFSPILVDSKPKSDHHNHISNILPKDFLFLLKCCCSVYRNTPLMVFFLTYF